RAHNKRDSALAWTRCVQSALKDDHLGTRGDRHPALLTLRAMSRMERGWNRRVRQPLTTWHAPSATTSTSRYQDIVRETSSSVGSPVRIASILRVIITKKKTCYPLMTILICISNARRVSLSSFFLKKYMHR